MRETEYKETRNLIFHIDDIFEIRNLSGIQISPDGSKIVYVRTVSDLNQNTGQDYIVLTSTSDKKSEILGEGSSPVWSPDGLSIAYHASQNNQTGIWIYSLKNHTTRFLTAVYESSYFINHLTETNFCWSPDGQYIAYVSTDPYSTPEAQDNQIMAVDRLLYKTKGGWGRPFFADGYTSHIWIIPTHGGEPQIITPGDYNEHSISWSPDSTQIAFISNHTADPDNNQNCDLWTVSIDTKKIEKLTHHVGTAFQPSWSPDGKHITYLATTSAISTNDSPADDTHLYIVPAGGGSPQCLTQVLDRRIENIQWHPLGEWVYFCAGNQGSTSLYRVSISNNEIETILAGNSQVQEYSLAPDGNSIAYISTDITHPSEIFLKKASEPSGVQITAENKDLLDERNLQEVKEFWFDSFDETPVQGWIMPPRSLQDLKKYPLILVIHGGPHNMFGYSFYPFMQLLAAQGYGVLFINPRGSSGYGQAFSKGTVLNWGGGDYKDLMLGLDYAIANNSWIDGEQLGVTGQSYGGYMTNWIITQTNRFKAAVVDGGISNLISFAGTSLYHSLMESEFNGSVYDNFSLLWQWSPLRNVKNVKTPTLFLHGTKDNEVPVTQAEEIYIALKKLGVTASFVQYLEEGHGWRPDLKPKSRYDLYNRVLNWFDEYLK
ncbi:S9 family peptidase [Adhaeribacter radiodurans]|uniref:S9 family peptidase n=1 Tax=Adhaeribacter radiodurans TaxID=2745197 RepID=A0A7L7L3J8_9BACT|nr:S9 family peptidase [Adhaeribacter radiodurans]QMU27388.1 S9 family peptidase [Adhaeribacter radiodurans]